MRNFLHKMSLFCGDSCSKFSYWRIICNPFLPSLRIPRSPDAANKPRCDFCPISLADCQKFASKEGEAFRSHKIILKFLFQLQLHEMKDLCDQMGFELFTITDLQFTKSEWEDQCLYRQLLVFTKSCAFMTPFNTKTAEYHRSGSSVMFCVMWSVT